jgi:hypothetical protein
MPNWVPTSPATSDVFETKCQLDVVPIVPVGDNWPAPLGALTD